VFDFTSGLPGCVCTEWRRTSFQDLPEELAQYRAPKTKTAVETYRGYYNTHIKGDLFALLKMAEAEEEDATEYITRRSVKKLGAKKDKAGRPRGGTKTFAGVIIFIRMAFRKYQKKNHQWFNPFQYINPPPCQ
jgi:hypothetical protein